MADDLDAPGALRLVDVWADSRADELVAGAPTAVAGAQGLVPLAVDALLGVRL
jgi:L-cysteine:1D-myo-inositol 2-amino-2-deoxy-alpha-D-glucopyranoside ligase